MAQNLDDARVGLMLRAGVRRPELQPREAIPSAAEADPFGMYLVVQSILLRPSYLGEKV